MPVWIRFRNCINEAPKVAYIEAESEAEGATIFEEKFGHNPYDRYVVSSEETLSEATAGDRNCDYDEDEDMYEESGDNHIPLDDYTSSENILIIYGA